MGTETQASTPDVNTQNTTPDSTPEGDTSVEITTKDDSQEEAVSLPGGDEAEGDKQSLPGGDEESSDAEEKGDEQKAPESYKTFDVPEGITPLTDEEHAAFSKVAKDLGLSPEKAQTLITFDADRTLAAVAAKKEQFNQDKADGLATSRKEFGDGFDAARQIGNKAYQAFVPKALDKILQDSGLNHHPEVFKLFNRIGKHLSEDSFVQEKGGNKIKEETLQDRFRYVDEGKEKPPKK